MVKLRLSLSDGDVYQQARQAADRDPDSAAARRELVLACWGCCLACRGRDREEANRLLDEAAQAVHLLARRGALSEQEGHWAEAIEQERRKSR